MWNLVLVASTNVKILGFGLFWYPRLLRTEVETWESGFTFVSTLLHSADDRLTTGPMSLVAAAE